MCTKLGIADLLAALRQIPEAFPGCRTRTGASRASRGQVVGNVGLLVNIKVGIADRFETNPRSVSRMPDKDRGQQCIT